MSALASIAGTLSGIASNPIGGIVSGASDAVAGLGLHAISSWVLGGTKAALEEVSKLIGSATAPNLDSTWFSSTYWRVAALAAMLTLPFLCAAAVQAVARADLGLLARAVFGHLPLSLLGVSLAAPLTMLLLAATDQMSRVVSASAAGDGTQFLDHAAAAAGAVSGASGSAFFAVVVGVLTVMAALGLAIELLIRAAAVYVVVLMLPLAFAAFVWPARRVWAVRLVELLFSLILSKFVIVAVLSLAAAAFASNDPGISQLLTAMALIMLSTLAPWALMRLLPFTEIAAGAAGTLRNELHHAGDRAMGHAPLAGGVSEFAMSLPARMRRQADEVDGGFTHDVSPAPSGQTSHADSSSQAAPPEPLPPQEAAQMSAPEGATETSSAPTTSERPPYVPPDFMLRDEPVRLDPESIARYADEARAAARGPGE